MPNKNTGLSKTLIIFAGLLFFVLVTVLIIGVIVANQNSSDKNNCSNLGESAPYYHGTDNTGGKTCCEGLVQKAPTHAFKNTDDEECSLDEGSGTVCLECGDNKCDDEYENYCNCPEDCKKDNASDDQASAKNMIIEEHPLVPETEDTPNHLEFKDHISSEILSTRSQWRTSPLTSSNISTSDEVDPYINQLNETLKTYNYKFERNISPQVPANNKALYDLYLYNNKVLENLTFIRNFQIHTNPNAFSFGAEQILSSGKIKYLTFYNGETFEWDPDHVIDPIIVKGELYEIIPKPKPVLDYDRGTEGETKDGYLIKTKNKEIYTFIPEENVYVSQTVLTFRNWNDKWILEYRNNQEENIIISDGLSVAENKTYNQVYNFTFVKENPLYFFEDSTEKIGLMYNDEPLPFTYDSIIHNNCCEASVFNPFSNENMVTFYALKRGVWYYVEAGVYDD